MARISEEGLEYKETKVKNLLDKVTVKLSGNRSGVFTRLAKKYKQIDRLIDSLNAKRDQLNEQVKENIGELFDAEDEVLTRVVDTVSLTATLAKRVAASSKTTTDFDAEGFVEELYEMMPELTEQLNVLRNKYTIIETVDVPEKSPALRVKVKESAETDVLAKISNYSELVAEKIDSNLHNFDMRFEALLRKASA